MVEALNNDWVQEVMNKTRTTHKVWFKISFQKFLLRELRDFFLENRLEKILQPTKDQNDGRVKRVFP